LIEQFVRAAKRFEAAALLNAGGNGRIGIVAADQCDVGLAAQDVHARKDMRMRAPNECDPDPVDHLERSSRYFQWRIPAGAFLRSGERIEGEEPPRIVAQHAPVDV